MKFKVINIEPTQTDSRLRFTCDVQVDDWMTWRNVCVFYREDGTRYIRPPVRQIHGPKKTIYEELVVIDSPIIQKQFQTEILQQLDLALEK